VLPSEERPFLKEGLISLVEGHLPQESDGREHIAGHGIE
jgi:hypothetical protein